jgi:hypothetical protein
MLAKLKKLIKLVGLTKVTNELGYRSVTTINKWFKNNEIPAIAQEKVRAYLSSKGL